MATLDLSSEIHTSSENTRSPHLNFNILSRESMTFGQVTEETGVLSFVPYASFLDKSISFTAMSVNPTKMSPSAGVHDAVFSAAQKPHVFFPFFCSPYGKKVALVYVFQQAITTTGRFY